MPKKMNKADKAMLTAVVVIAVLAGGYFLNLRFSTLAISPDAESQLKSEYTTLWADSTDGIIEIPENGCEKTPSSYGAKSNTNTDFSNVIQCYKFLTGQKNTVTGQFNVDTCTPNSIKIPDITSTFCVKDPSTGSNWYENDKVQWGGDAHGVYMIGGKIVVETGDIKFKKSFRGQEIALIAGGNGNLNTNLNHGRAEGDEFVKVILKPHTLEPIRWDVIKYGEKTGEITAGEDGFLYIEGSGTNRFNAGRVLQIEYVGYKAQFSCDLSENERWIQTQWVGSVSMDDITKKDGFIPTKFCKETRPFILRDIQQGETAIFPDPIPAFNRGEMIVTPSTSQFIVVNYAVYQVAGLENPTTGTQAYKCIQRDSNYKCLGWAIEEVIKPVEVVVQCKADADCYVPTKSQCFGYFRGCINNKCTYDESIPDSPICKNEVVTIIKQIQEVDKRVLVSITGINTFTFSQNHLRSSFNIGDKMFTATQPSYSCEVPTDTDFLYAPSPSSDCWKTRITYDGKNIELKDTQSALIHPFISVQYFAGGKLTRGKFNRPEDWHNTFIFTIQPDALDLNVEDSGFVIQNSQKKINLKMLNKLPSGDAVIKVQQRVKAINQNLPEQSVSKYINSGDDIFSVDMNTENLGINSITIQVFYKIKADAEVLIPSDKFILNYDVVTQLPSVTKVVEVEKIVPIVQEKQVEKIADKAKTPLWLWWALVITILFAVGLLLWERYSKR